MPDIKSRIGDILLGGLLAPTIALGRRLGLFEALAAVGSKETPADPEAIANHAGCKPRFVREWLGAMACGGLIQVTEDEKFYMEPEIVQEFIDYSNLEVAMMDMIPNAIKTFDELAYVFKKDGPPGLRYEQFCGFYQAMDGLTRAMHDKHLLSNYFPYIGMDDKLKAGGLKILDVGCGSGYHAIMMAKAFPGCEVTAVDISPAAIELAEKQLAAETTPLNNLKFHVMDAGHMSAEWTQTFDFITIYDACHDQCRPDLCIQEIHRLLKPNGVFAMLEIRGSSSIYTDAKENPAFSSAFYSISMFHCLAVGSNDPNALGMGAMWGVRRAEQLLRASGFSDIRVLHPEFFLPNVVYVCTK